MKENKVIIITMFLNLFIAVLKLISGILFSFSTLIADSIQSFMDLVTDITSLIANKIGKRRANKTYPFGYGQVYYLANMFTGFLLFLIGVFILCQFFLFDGVLKINKFLFLILILLIILKLVVVTLLKRYGKKYKSELMIEASKESYADFISTCVVLTILILTLFEKYIPFDISIDKIGNLIMAVYVFYISIKMIIQNVKGILTNDDENNNIKKEVMEDLKTFKDLEIVDVRVINMSAYYSIFIQIKVCDNLSIKKYLLIEKKIKKHLKSKNKLFRFIDVEPV